MDGSGRQLGERGDDDLTESLEVTLGFRMRTLDGDLRPEELAGLEVKRIGERDDPGIAEQDTPVPGLDLLGQTLERGDERDGSGLLVDDRRRSRGCPSTRDLD